MRAALGVCFLRVVCVCCVGHRVPVLCVSADEEQRREVVRAAGPPQRAAEERAAGAPRRRRNLAAVVANRRPQRDGGQPGKHRQLHPDTLL